MARWTFPGGIGGGVCRCGAVAMLVWLTGGVLSAADPSRLEISAGPASAEGQVETTGLKLTGSRAGRQLVVTAVGPEGATARLRDATHEAQYRVEPPSLASVTAGGFISPRANGNGTIVVDLAGMPEARMPLAVERFNADPPLDLETHVVPIFTKHGCNGGGCHGKSGGQNGFRLSLLGFEPAEDYEHLAQEARGRRISVVAPDLSLLLLKATATVPHGGGRLIEPGSPSYEIIARWIAEGGRPGSPQAPRVARIDVFPADRVMRPADRQQLRVLAELTDGSTEDVTKLAQFEVNAPDLAAVDSTGLVTASPPGNGPPRSGTAAVMVRYQSQVAVFRATLPLESVAVGMPAPEAFVRTFVDTHVLDRLVSLRLPPSPRCDDTTFLRRVTVDIAGRLPTLDESLAFLADGDPAKRDRLIDRLLDSPDYADYFANTWSAILRNKRTNDALHRHGSYSFHEWIRASLADNMRYSQFVREIITATGEVGDNPAVIWYRQVADANQQVEDASQLFLGLRLQCARGHHHPFEKWGTKDYFQFAAFFSRVGRKKGLQPGEDRIFHNRGEPQAAGPKGTHQPAVLGGTPDNVPPDVDPRGRLADWMTAVDNPYLARSLVNRYWKHFLGRGLVEPEDDMRLTNPPTNPPLLDALAKHFVDHGYDLKDLIRVICRSSTYQLSAEPNDANSQDRQSYSRFYPRRLTAEVALDAIDQLTEKPTQFGGVLPGTRAVQLPDSNFNSYFLTVFGRPNGDSPCECERGAEATLAQSLHLINSADILGKLAASRAARLAADAGRSNAAKIDELYVVAFSRPASPTEVADIETHLTAHTLTLPSAWEDVIWSILNTKEFLFTH